MFYPTISQYIQYMLDRRNLSIHLKHLTPLLDNDGKPIIITGEHSVVFKMKTKLGSVKAIKCFTDGVEASKRDMYYLKIEDFFEDKFKKGLFPYLVNFKYLKDEILFERDSNISMTFPVVIMDWIDGIALDQYIHIHIGEKRLLQMVAYKFSLLAIWLKNQPFAHGNINPNNIIVGKWDDTLQLIDYDNMFVPSMKGMPALSLCSPNYRNPYSSVNDFDANIDDFSMLSLFLSLRIIAEEPSSLGKYANIEHLLFTQKDYQDLNSCRVLKDLFPFRNKDINFSTSFFIQILSQKDKQEIPFKYFIMDYPDRPDEYRTTVTEDDLKNSLVDEYDSLIKYSNDIKKLLRAPHHINGNYGIEDVQIICDKAFEHSLMVNYSIHEGVTAIGCEAFKECNQLITFHLPESLRQLGKSAFQKCFYLEEINIPHCLTALEDYTFDGCHNLMQINIPNLIERIGCNCFSGTGLRKITIPGNVKLISDKAFYNCTSLSNVHFSDGIKTIGKETFAFCSSLRNVILPLGITELGEMAFIFCASLCNVYIPGSLKVIGQMTFASCKNLRTVLIDNGVEEIGSNAFWGCESLESIELPNSLKKIDKTAFDKCNNLKRIRIGAWAYKRVRDTLPVEIRKLMLTV